MVYAQPRICPGEWDAQTHLGFWDTNDHLISARRPDLKTINKKVRTWKIVESAVLAYHRVKLKECEKRDKYLDLARELKELWNKKVTIIPITLGTVIKELIQGLEDLEITGRMETVQITALLRSARILRRVLETWGDFRSLSFQWKTSANADVKNS